MAPVTRLERDAPDLRTANMQQLERLAAVLAGRGIDAQPVAPPGRMPRLQVTHPAGGSGDVYAWRCLDGAWWFWWPWAERVARGTDLAGAAATIEQVLARPRGD
jgi:hypothetical protein